MTPGQRVMGLSEFRWMCGMGFVAANGNQAVVLRVREEDGWLYLAPKTWGNQLGWYNPLGGHPDMDDPATLGCVVAMLRGKHGPHLTTMVWPTGWMVAVGGRSFDHTNTESYADAVVSALAEPCPSPEVTP